jgi:hypothetical protein
VLIVVAVAFLPSVVAIIVWLVVAKVCTIVPKPTNLVPSARVRESRKEAVVSTVTPVTVQD